MNGTSRRLRRIFVVLFLLAVLLAALTPATSGLLLPFLIPLWFFFAVILTIQGRIADKCIDLPLLPNLPIFSSRPPPAR
jgi:hypothetical protein